MVPSQQRKCAWMSCKCCMSVRALHTHQPINHSHTHTQVHQPDVSMHSCPADAASLRTCLLCICVHAAQPVPLSPVQSLNASNTPYGAGG
ncbi:hypothetical protein DUNSADRAFT_7860 [Dunaliella salina]|uniref:Encoded protein n=1 Tax=Dunaliella salina TaxID=3046 RepID=A0ABQ7FT34_DUNSA|nr:hypothetical protein DUNSADRAFT_7860 [Dunaliella salina]|eukprot:KAF5825646.1 hypothetical protein DUNSADRAFT_7860 [Dunaliella salina]